MDLLANISESIFAVEKLDDPLEGERRYNICESNTGDCYSGKFFDFCKECKCIMRVKTTLKRHRELGGEIVITHCPLAKWGDLEIANFYREKKGLPLL